MSKKIYGLLLAASMSASLLVVGIGTGTAIAAHCRGWVKPHATVGGIVNTTQGSFDAYYTGHATAGRSPCWKGKQRIVLTHQAYKYHPSKGWVRFVKNNTVAVVRRGHYGILQSKQEFAPLNMTATTTVRWYRSGGKLIAKRFYSMNGAAWYSCPNGALCTVYYDPNLGSHYIHWM